MNKEFIPYEQALALKELGFDEPCFGLYTRQRKLLEKTILSQQESEFYFGGFLAPLYQQAFKWFREKHELFVYPNRTVNEQGVYYYFVILNKRTEVCEGSFIYEEAELACLNKLTELVKQQTNHYDQAN